MSGRDPFDRRAKRSPVRTIALWIAVAAAVPAVFGLWFWFVETYIDGPSQTFWALGGIWLTLFLLGLFNVPTIVRAFRSAYDARAVQPDPIAGFTSLELAILQEVITLSGIRPDELTGAFRAAQISTRINTGTGCVTSISQISRLPPSAVTPVKIVGLDFDRLPHPAGATLWPGETEDTAFIEVFTGGQDTRSMDWLSTEFTVTPAGATTPPLPTMPPLAAVLESERHFADRTARDLYQ